MTEQMPDVIYCGHVKDGWNSKQYICDELRHVGDTKYLKASHVEATTVPKAKVDYLISFVQTDIFGQFNNVPELREDFDEALEYVIGNAEIKPTVPRDKAEVLITLVERCVNDHGAYLNMNSGDEEMADSFLEAIKAIRGEGE